MIGLYKPELSELWFRRKLLADEATMSYNLAWGGTIPFPESEWKGFYDHWLIHHDNKRWYRYLKRSEDNVFVGETAYHFDDRRGIWLADVIVADEFRGRGCGTEGLRLMCRAAAKNGVDVLRDDIALDNPAVHMFFKAGFTEEYRTDMIIMLKKELSGSSGSGRE